MLQTIGVYPSPGSSLSTELKLRDYFGPHHLSVWKEAPESVVSSILTHRKLLTTVASNKRIIINVSGEVYETYLQTLNRYPDTLLGMDEKRERLYNPSRQEIFLNRNRASFEAILFFYQSNGNLIRPSNVSMEDFVEECNFYLIPDHALKRMKGRENYLHRTMKILPKSADFGPQRKRLWAFLDHPYEGSRLAKLYSMFSIAMIFASVMIVCLRTEYVRVKDAFYSLLTTEWKFELPFNIFFALEFTVRFYAHPYRKAFLSIPLNFVELIAIFPMFGLLFCPPHLLGRLMMYLCRCLQALRLARLSKPFYRIRVAIRVFQESVNDVGALIFLTLIMSVLSGSIMYYIEYDISGSQFDSIPQGMWWSIQTVVCLGYGDIVPITVTGKIFGGILAFIGVTVVTVSLVSMSNRFFDAYVKAIRVQRFNKTSSRRI